MKQEPSRELAERLTLQLDQLMARLVMARLPVMQLTPGEAHTVEALSRHETLPMSALAEGMGLPLSTTTHRMDGLVKKKLVKRGRNALDRRVVEISLSAAGRKLAVELRAMRLAMSSEMLKPLTPGERELLVELIGKINAVSV